MEASTRFTPAENMVATVTKVGSVALPLCVLGFEFLDNTRFDKMFGIAGLGVVGGIGALFLLSLCCVARKTRVALLGFGVSAVALVWLVASFAPGGDRIISRVTAAGGTEICVVQRYTSLWSEPYEVRFYYRRPGQAWGWFYFDHQDTRWWMGKISLSRDGRRATIRRVLLPVAYFDIPAEAFTIVRRGSTASLA